MHDLEAPKISKKPNSVNVGALKANLSSRRFRCHHVAMWRSRPGVSLSIVALLLAVSTSAGCKDEKETGPDGPRIDVRFEAGQLFQLEVVQVKVDKLLGGKEAESEFKAFVNHNRLLFYVQSNSGVLWLGVTAPPASYGESTYQRVRGKADHLYFRVPNAHLELIKDDGTEIALDISSMRLEPRKKDPETGVVTGEFEALVQGGFVITRGDSRLTGDFEGTWQGVPDTRAPTAIVIPPAPGLVSGAFDVYFDEPVTAKNMTERVFLRDKAGKAVRSRVWIREGHLKDYTTHIRLETTDLLPFNERLTLAVGTGFEDLVGNKLTKPVVTAIITPDLPPLLTDTLHTFDSDPDDDSDYRIQGQFEIVEEFASIKPYRGKLLKLTPPRAGSRFSSALITRVKVPHDATHIQARVLKVARSRDMNTPCIRMTIAQTNGTAWNVECEPRDAPTLMVTDDAGNEFFTTRWVPMTVQVIGQRGQEVVLIMEARPLDAAMSPTTEPVFLVDMLRIVKEGQDSGVFE